MRPPRFLVKSLLASVALGAVLVVPSAQAARVCLPGVTLPAVRLPAVQLPPVYLPPVDLPGGCIGDYCYPPTHIPGRHIPGQYIPAQYIPGQRIPGSCYSDTAGGQLNVSSAALGGTVRVPAAFSPLRSTVRVRNYRVIDPSYSAELSSSYWRRSGPSVSIPDVTASGFGELNAAGFPKNQYVRGYIRRDGTVVSGYWRNSPTDGLPTCRVISC